jgi:hypothetical protein
MNSIPYLLQHRQINYAQLMCQCSWVQADQALHQILLHQRVLLTLQFDSTQLGLFWGNQRASAL